MPDFEIEKGLLKQGYKIVAGVDECGRGCLAGPLCVGLVIFGSEIILGNSEELSCVDDSKKLPHPKRVSALESIRKNAILACSAYSSHNTIDELNINGATEYAIKKLLSSINIKPDVIIIDGKFRFNPGVKCIPIIKGDSKSISIASASIAAKVKRDALMERIDPLFPCYGFARHKGYGTLLHRKNIEKYGYSPVHRKSYEPVKGMIESEGLK